MMMRNFKFVMVSVKTKDLRLAIGSHIDKPFAHGKTQISSQFPP